MKLKNYFLLLSIAFISLTGGNVKFVFAQAPAKAVNFTKQLRRGMSDPEVKKLQLCLRRNPSFYPEGLVTGYFGSATEKAVQKFQAANNIVSSGTPAETGFGAVGLKTRAKLEIYCQSALANSGRLYMRLPPVKSVSNKTSQTARNQKSIQTEIEKVLQAEGISKENLEFLRNSPISSAEGEQALKETLAEYGNLPLETPGPENCGTLNECKSYCNNPKNFGACLVFIKKFLKNSL